jgi:hypothetical protein
MAINIVEVGAAPGLPHDAFEQWYKSQKAEVDKVVAEPDPEVRERMISQLSLVAFMTGIMWASAIPTDNLKVLRKLLKEMAQEMRKDDAESESTAE